MKSHRSLNNDVKFSQAKLQALHFVSLGVLFAFFVVVLQGQYMIASKINAHISFIISKW